MWKIVEATWIGTEYFQTDLDIASAISKYNIDTQICMTLQIMSQVLNHIFKNFKF